MSTWKLALIFFNADLISCSLPNASKITVKAVELHSESSALPTNPSNPTCLSDHGMKCFDKCSGWLWHDVTFRCAQSTGCSFLLVFLRSHFCMFFFSVSENGIFLNSL